jgi:DeoR family deoxyribose operon repressor
MKNKQKRLETLKKMLQEERSMKISDISRRLGVSPMTTRRDIDILSSEGIVKVLHGAVVYDSNNYEGTLSDYMLTVAENRNVEEKREIGKFAASMVEENDIIFIDAGSTTEFFTSALPDDISFTVVCYSINIFLAISALKNVEVVLMGGRYNRRTTIFEQTQSTDSLQNNRTRKAFLSAGGLHAKLGVTCANQSECLVKRAALASTAESYLLIDSTKFGHVHSCFFAHEDDFDHIITNRDAPREYVELLQEKHISVHYV